MVVYARHRKYAHRQHIYIMSKVVRHKRYMPFGSAHWLGHLVHWRAFAREAKSRVRRMCMSHVCACERAHSAEQLLYQVSRSHTNAAAMVRARYDYYFLINLFMGEIVATRSERTHAPALSDAREMHEWRRQRRQQPLRVCTYTTYTRSV